MRRIAVVHRKGGVGKTSTCMHLAGALARLGRRVLLIGLGARPEFDAERARVAAAVAHRRARELSAGTLCWEVPHHVGDEIVAG